MSETPPEKSEAPGDGETGSEQTAGEARRTSIGVNAQYVKDLSFENPRAPQSLMATREQPHVDVDVNVNARTIQDNVHEVSVSIRVNATVGGETAFIADLVYAGMFTVENIPEDSLRPFLLIECPRILFPFARRIIADTTRDGGFPPLLINPIDFAALYRRQFDLDSRKPEGEA